jgi:hybrid cluster-associated redox disulfide protein
MAANPEKLSPLLTVKDLLDRYPQALPAFMRLHLLCVGCPTEAFHTLADVAREYDLDIDDLMRSIQSAITDRPC